jgi:hypothetical protein
MILAAKAKPARFAVDKRGLKEVPVSALAKKKKKKAKKGGTTISYALSETARTVFTVELKTKGRRKKGSKCRKQTKKNRKGKRCTLWKLSGRFAHAGAGGVNSKPFSGRIGAKKLKKGSYRATLVATDPSGNVSQPRVMKFRVIKPKRKKR